MRIAKIPLLLAALAVTFVGGGKFPRDVRDRQIVFRDLLAGEAPVRIGNELEVAGAWWMRSRQSSFGNYSALAIMPGGRLLAISDRNAMLAFARPDGSLHQPAFFGRPLPDDFRLARLSADAEAVSLIPSTGELLVAVEGSDRIFALRRDFKAFRTFTVPALWEWPVNQGPEAAQVLADGRLVLIGETYAHRFDRRLHPALLFPGLPRAGEAPGRFLLEMPEGYRPTDLAQMPDGRLLVLGRKFTLMGFRSVIMTADPAALRAGAVVRTHEIARIDDPRVRDNYEGMAVSRERDGSTAIWIISDSNAMVWMQRTILLKLRFRSGRAGGRKAGP
ncbi:esterase-like activity of phytase family protein [Novosphingobium sp. KCTC 2891]|uniref:esterase-like activity of phytase family protein n=1 Tax=Novosphingobium sp. KCTC 2891 TaxID=2989730 RepID=UPI0022214256|nr:esterase-like activity of phytase family protein [Novosphingobium sp. KCTC 2891]MCW1382125.1 esterase-like activity of phytase family protein [Novosphingobium sp. KCTC 2891]